MIATPRRIALCLALPLALAGCDREDPGAPAEYEPASVAIAFSFPTAFSGVAGLQEAYLKTDRLWLQFRDQSAARDERQLDFQPSVQESHVPLSIRLRSASEAFTFNVEVRLGSAGVFRGTAPVTLRAGRLTSVTATLTPILAGVRAPDTVPVLTAWGDTVRLAAAGILATGDTIEGISIDWTALDPGVASIDPGGKVLGKTDGTARMVASSGSFADTATVRILAQVATVRIDPPATSIPLGGTQQFTATLYDRNGNALPGRPVTWSSSNTGAVTINQNGLATGVGIGTSQINGLVSNSSAAAQVTTVPIPPKADSIHALVTGTSTVTLTAVVFPNGAPTNGWFEYGSRQISIPPSVILPTALGSGLGPVPIESTLSGLRPNTLYYAVAHALNSAGAGISDTIWFTTGTPPVTGGAPVATTVGWTSIGQPLWAVLIGSVETHAVATDTWFEWGKDPSLQTSQKTAVQNVTNPGGVTVTESVQLPSTGTFYFRFVAQNANGSSNGAILSLTMNAPQAPVPSTGPAINVTFDAARLTGTVNPNGLGATAWFDWGTSPTLASFTSSPAQQVGSGNAPVPVIFDVTGLTPNTTYYVRLNGSNGAGTSAGSIVSFTTTPDPNVTPPAVTTDKAVFGPTGFTLKGTVNPMGSATTVWFEWAPVSSPSNFTATPEQAAGAGNAPLGFSELLPKGIEGYYRAVARNAGGTVYGALLPFQI